MSLKKFLAKQGKGKAMPMMESAHGEQMPPKDEGTKLHHRMGMKVGKGMEHLDYDARDELASKHGDPDHGYFMRDLDGDEGKSHDMDEIEQLLHDTKRHIARIKNSRMA